MKTEFSGTVTLDSNDINDAIRDYIVKTTGMVMTDWSADISYKNDDYYDRGTGTPYLNGIVANINVSALNTSKSAHT